MVASVNFFVVVWVYYQNMPMQKVKLQFDNVVKCLKTLVLDTREYKTLLKYEKLVSNPW